MTTTIMQAERHLLFPAVPAALSSVIWKMSYQRVVVKMGGSDAEGRYAESVVVEGYSW
jgi:hypothetical protein